MIDYIQAIEAAESVLFALKREKDKVLLAKVNATIKSARESLVSGDVSDLKNQYAALYPDWVSVNEIAFGNWGSSADGFSSYVQEMNAPVACAAQAALKVAYAIIHKEIKAACYAVKLADITKTRMENIRRRGL